MAVSVVILDWPWRLEMGNDLLCISQQTLPLCAPPGRTCDVPARTALLSFDVPIQTAHSPAHSASRVGAPAPAQRHHSPLGAFVGDQAESSRQDSHGTSAVVAAAVSPANAVPSTRVVLGVTTASALNLRPAGIFDVGCQSSGTAIATAAIVAARSAGTVGMAAEPAGPLRIS